MFLLLQVSVGLDNLTCQLTIDHGCGASSGIGATRPGQGDLLPGEEICQVTT